MRLLHKEDCGCNLWGYNCSVQTVKGESSLEVAHKVAVLSKFGVKLPVD